MNTNIIIPSITTESKRLLFTYNHIINNFYNSNNFIILPSFNNIPTELITRTVIFNPSDEILNILKTNKKDTLERLSEQNYDLPSTTISDEILNNAREYIRDIEKVLNVQLVNKYKSVDIIVTKIGTIGSSFYAGEENLDNNTIYIREDCINENNLFELITHIYLNDPEIKGKYSWTQRMAIKEFVRTYTSLNKYYTKEHNIYNDLKILNNDGKYKLISHEYLKKLQLLSTSSFQILDYDIKCNGSLLNLGIKEYQVLKLLIENRGKIVSYENIFEANNYKDNNDNYSLFAISKIIERIRNKITKIGIYGEQIRNIKGKGYTIA